MPSERGLNFLVARWMALGEWRAHPARILVAALAVTVGVALGFAVHVVNRSALDQFARAVRTVDGEADLQVHSTSPSGFGEALYPTLARLPGVQAASPVVELTATTPGAASIPILGLDVMRAAAVTPSLVGRAAANASTDPQAAFEADRLYLSQGALDAMRRRVGDDVTLRAGGRVAAFIIAGTLPGVAEDQRLGVVDIGAAQWRWGALGRLQRIDLRLAADADREQVERAVRAALPSDAQIVTRQAEAQRGDSLSRAYRVNLEMLAMMALLTGGFLVYSAQSLSVARRRPQFALLRVLGLGRRALLAQVGLEGGVIGLVGAVAGVAVGLALAEVALSLFGGDLGGGYFQGSRPKLAIEPVGAMVFLALGLGAALAGSLLPALRAGRVRPAVALKTAGDAGDPRQSPPAGPALALLAAGGAAAFAPPLWGLPLFGYAAIALMLAGGVAATPWLARRLLAPLQGWRTAAPAAHLAIRRLWGAPAQASLALCGVVASTSLMIAMAVMVSSFRGSVEDWLTRVLPSDLYIRIDADQAGGLDAAARRRIQAAPGLASVRFLKTIPLRLAADKPAVALIAEPIDRHDPARTLPLLGASRAVPAGSTPIWVSEPMVWLYGRHPGERMVLPLGGAARPVFVAGVWRDYARQQGALAMRDSDYVRFTGDDLKTEAAIDVAPGASIPSTEAALRAALTPEIATHTAIAQPREIRVVALALFDRSFAVTYALEAIAIGVGLTGVAATFSAQTLARTKEFGMLRHIGVSRGEIVWMLAIEGALLGAVGVVAGIGLGIGMGEVLIHVVNPQSFHWTMQTRLPLGLFAGLATTLIAASAGTAVLAGRRALSADAVRAVREDW